jgi:lipopolysaccharide assembly outer membrane protein LptD (OstA)
VTRARGVAGPPGRVVSCRPFAPRRRGRARIMPRFPTMPMVRLLGRLPALVALLAVASPALAQVPGFSVSRQFTLERLADSHWRLTGQVEMEREDQKFFADVVDYYPDRDRIEASGNVVYVSKESRIAADRMEFSTRTRLGAFHNASGTMSLGTRVDRSMFGTQEPDAFFYGETIEKVGPSKYRITKGGFTTCVQPTPRWEITSSTATLTVDEYAILKNAVLNVKGVPLLYLPVLYYPIQEDDRSTGFLIPQYGNSTIRGQSLSNAFFWAISRNADATVFHDWFTRVGQGVGGEFRYIAAPGSEGQVRTYFLDQNATTYQLNGGATGSLPDSRSYEIRASAVQKLPAGLRVRGNVDYFSSITVQQTYYGNLYDASRRQRLYGANVSGAWGAWSLSGTYSQSELFFGESDSTVYGTTPRIAFNRASRKIGSTPIYWSFTTDYSNLVRTYNVGTRSLDSGLPRFDASPTVRVPFTKWPFLQLSGVLSWRNTWYGESLDARGAQVEQSVFRQYFDLRGEVIGPTFTRIWDTPANGYADKFKHVIEPNFTVQRVTKIDNYNQLVKLDSYDYTYGGTTRIGYGLTQRFLARRMEGGKRVPREFLNVSVSQAYYSDERASQYDPAYASSFYGLPPSNFTPISLNVRATPATEVNGSFRMEYDTKEGSITSMRANGTATMGGVQVFGGWSQRRYEMFQAFAVRSDNYLNLGTNLRLLDGRVGGQYLFDYDFSRGHVLQQRIQGFFNSQCCGVAVEYQKYNFPVFDPRFPVPNDRRFTISFTLAGIGTFANPLGMFGNGMSNSSGGF